MLGEKKRFSNISQQRQAAKTDVAWSHDLDNAW